MLEVDFCSVFLSNPIYDSRLVNLDESLNKIDKSTAVIGFNWFEGKTISPKPNWFIYNIKRRPSLIFYFKFVLITFFKLFSIKSKTYIAEDVYSLPIVYFWAKIRKAKVFYNSREFYFALGGLAKKEKIQNLIARIEKRFICKVDRILVTGDLDKEVISKYYQISNISVIRNIPKMTFPTNVINFRKIYRIPEGEIILIYQGILQGGRGISRIIKLMKDLSGFSLIIVGDGPQTNEYRNLVKESKINDRVFFTGLVKHSQLINYSAGADLGLAIIENISMSYYYALPNKLFEYLNSGIPILSSNLPQMKKIIEEYNIGFIIDLENESQDELKEQLLKIKSNPELLSEMKANIYKAENELNWEKEFERNRELFH